MEPASAFATAKNIEEGAKIGWNLWEYFKSKVYPKAKAGEIGIVIALEAEGESVHNQIHNDLIHNLKKLAGSGNSNRPFKIIALPPQHQKKIKSQDDAERVLEKCRSKLMIWGQAKARNVNGNEYTVIELNVIASHNLIVQPISVIFANEMRELIPERFLVPKDNNLLEMELNAVGMDLAAHYIVAVACYFSDDKPYALELFQVLERKLGALDATHFSEERKSHIALLKKKVLLNIVNIYLRFARDEHMKWRRTRKVSFIEKANELAQKADAIIPNLYTTAIIGSVYSFIVEENPGKARRILAKWTSTEDATWAFNIAFLCAFEGNLNRAAHFYRIGFRRESDSKVLLEIEEFLEWAMEQFPTKYQLHYSLGMMMFFGRDEVELGREQFRTFLRLVPSGEFKTQVSEVRKYLDPAFRKTKSIAK